MFDVTAAHENGWQYYELHCKNAKNSDIYSFKLPRTVIPYNFRVVKTVKNKLYVAMICCRELNADLILQLCTAVNALYLHIMVSA